MDILQSSALRVLTAAMDFRQLLESRQDRFRRAGSVPS
jgi:hypothetical protein